MATIYGSRTRYTMVAKNSPPGPAIAADHDSHVCYFQCINIASGKISSINVTIYGIDQRSCV